MSRDIRFRAWDKTDKVMRDMPLFLNGTKVFTIHQGGMFNGNEPMLLETDKYEVMQYTGLKDKNGKEIYEGDIVTYSAVVETGATEECVGTILWFKELGAYGIDYHPKETKPDFIYHVGEDVLEVIGNIFENPDLLTPNK